MVDYQVEALKAQGFEVLEGAVMITLPGGEVVTLASDGNSMNVVENAVAIPTIGRGTVVMAPTMRGNVGMPPYMERIVRRLAEQNVKGMRKYGQLLHENTDSMPNRLEHLAQELTDGLQYIEWAKDEHDRINGLTVDIVAKAVAAVQLIESVAHLKQYTPIGVKDVMTDLAVGLMAIADMGKQIIDGVGSHEDNEPGCAKGTHCTR